MSRFRKRPFLKKLKYIRYYHEFKNRMTEEHIKVFREYLDDAQDEDPKEGIAEEKPELSATL